MIVSAAAVSAATIPDPLDHLGLVQYLIFFSFSIAGWACSELKTLAAWVGGTPEARLEILQKFVIALCAGVGMAMLVQAGVPWYWDVDAPKIASRGGAFLAAYGGTRTLNAFFDSAINVAQGTVERLRQGRQDPPRPPGP